MQSSDFTKLAYKAKGYVHATDSAMLRTPCGLSVKRSKVQPQTMYFGTNCPQCYAFVTALRADEDAKGLHDVTRKPVEEQSALVIFMLKRQMTQDFTISPGYAHAVERRGFGEQDRMHTLLRRFEATLHKDGRWPTDTALITSRFLVFAASNEQPVEHPAMEWTICRNFKDDGTNVQNHTYWLTFHPEGTGKPERSYQQGTC